jgi:MFS family permease
VTANPTIAGNPRIFYGWVVVAAGFAVTFVGFGCVYSFSAFIESLQSDFGASRGSISLVFSLAGFLYFTVGCVSGPLADRFGSRRLAAFGMVLIAVGLAAASAAQSLMQVYVAYGLVSALASAAPMCPPWARCNAGSSSIAALPRVWLRAASAPARS